MTMEEEDECSQCTETDSDSPDKKRGGNGKVRWTQEEDENLKILVNSFGKKDWKVIASFLPGRTLHQCIHRWKKHVNPDLGKKPWSKEEDEKLMELVGFYGTKHWEIIAKHMKGRLSKHCEERWQSYLDPVMQKSYWTIEEDLIIYKAQAVLGNRWADISKLLPGRSDKCVRNRWNAPIKRRAELGWYKDEAESISLDLQQFIEGEVNFKCDVVLDAEPVFKELIQPKKPEQQQKESVKHKQEEAASPPKALPPKAEASSSSPPSRPSSTSSPSSTCAAAATEKQADQKMFAEAALRMIAEDMLPLSFVEGAGFRSFMGTISPEYNKLTQRSVGLLLYDHVERNIKPQLIRDLKGSLAQAKGSEGIIHVTFDLWTGSPSRPQDNPIVVVQLHFVNQAWQIRRPVVAFRHLSQKNLSTAVAKELEGVLLSYGIFPQRIGYVLSNQAKIALTRNNLFCNFKVMCSSQRGDPDGEELVALLSDQTSETELPFSELQIGTRTACVAKTLQMVIEDALKNSRVVENLLFQVHNVVAFFKSSTYWSEVLFKKSNLSLCPPSTNCSWNSMMLSLRRMVQESAWSATMAVLSHARIEASDSSSIPPLVIAKREQVVDILGLLEPFEEALQVLQGNGVTVSSIVPTLVVLDKTLEDRSTNYTHFRRALRTGLCKHFQSFIQEKDLILAAVLDPRIKLQPFSEEKLMDHTDFLVPLSKREARSIVESECESLEASACPVVKVEKDESGGELMESQADVGSGTEATGNGQKRKSSDSSPQPPAKTMKTCEVEAYLSEPLWENTSSIIMYWKSAVRFPKLQSIARRLLAVPATSGGFDRLCSMALCIVRAKRNRLPQHTTERLLLYKNSFKAKPARKPNGVSKQ
ncbi:v-myb avian myeloblastosis viral oncogene homolog-like 2a isoform X2 [Salarias fasciatus]|uniref:v-myb avian myeloblastosis viral oncogene homolog-like 2a isoform X2 n=1 Tax=Salarias fasciatus TaxID=181472 RepID=UPI0011765A3C|nr:uncharacterized protein LOC115407898 isoform X2 [Salarias fasciatus]